MEMADNFTKTGKSAEDVHQLLTYVARPGIQKDEVKDIYEKWSTNYDKDMQEINYKPSTMLVEEVATYYGSNQDIKVLDIAAGTGTVGKRMYDQGFRNIHAIDASAQMLEEAKKLGVYKKFYQAFIGKNRLDIPDNTYDLLVTSGSFVPGHLNDDCFEELIRITRKGGHIFIIMMERYFKDNPDDMGNLEPHMMELQQQGEWKLLERKIKENYYNDLKGVLFILEKC